MKPELLCQQPDADCERRWVRTRGGIKVCSFHPEHHAPHVDPHTGKPRETPQQIDARRRAEQAAQRALEPKTPAVPPQRTERPTKPARPDARRPTRTVAPKAPRSPAFDPQAAARRYVDGTGLGDLAAELHIGTRTLREALKQQGVTLRGRGQVLGTRGRPIVEIDHDEVLRAYQAGETTSAISRRLHVKTGRISDLLRAAGVLRRPGQRAPIEPSAAPRPAPRPTPRPAPRPAPRVIAPPAAVPALSRQEILLSDVADQAVRMTRHWTNWTSEVQQAALDELTCRVDELVDDARPSEPVATAAPPARPSPTNLLEHAEKHTDPAVRQAAEVVRRSVEALVAGLAQADVKTRWRTA